MGWYYSSGDPVITRAPEEGGESESKANENLPFAPRDPDNPYTYIPTRSGDVHTTKKGEFPDYGFDVDNFTEAKENAVGQLLQTEAAVFLW